jgi:hypothetical protein
VGISVRRGTLVAGWGVGGAAALLAWAAVRLGARGADAIRGGLEPAQWLVFVALAVVFLYGEGVLALDRRWAPKVLARARRVSLGDRRALQVLAPLHAMGLVGGPAATAMRSWAGVVAVVGAVLLVRALPDPWRGMIDVAVALALAWGAAALLRRAVAEGPSLDGP